MKVHSRINFFYLAMAIAMVVYSHNVITNVDQFQQIWMILEENDYETQQSSLL